MLRVNAMPPVSTPLISVIVVCRNPGTRLRDTLASIWAQRDVRPELIVMDGDSTDGSRAWLESQRAHITTLVSAPDRGVYDAMNQGLALAHGKWVLFLGADDRLCHGRVLADALLALAPSTAGVGVGEIAYDDGRIYRLEKTPNPPARNFVHHQGAFYRRELFAAQGPFDPSLTIMADYDLNVRLWKNRVTFCALPLRIATCGAGGLSDSGRWRGYREEITVRHRHYPGTTCWFWDLLSVLRCARKKILRRAR